MKHIFYIILCSAGITQAAAAAAHSSGIPPHARSTRKTLDRAAAVHQLKLRASGLASEKDLDALETLVYERKYAASPEQPARSTQKNWINPEIAHANVATLMQFCDDQQDRSEAVTPTPQYRSARRLFPNAVSDD